MARGQRDRGKERHWRRHVAAWRRSGQSVRAYCQAHALSEPCFYVWRRVLAERDASVTARRTSADKKRASEASESSAFLPVRLVEATSGTAHVDVVLRGGRIVRVVEGFAAETLRDVVAVLEGLPC